MSDFKKGDVVKLKSGSPDMTVVEIFNPEIKTQYTIHAKVKNLKKGDLICRWFDDLQEKISYYEYEAIEKVN